MLQSLSPIDPRSPGMPPDTEPEEIVNDEETAKPGTSYKEDEEQDLDDLVHQQAEENITIPPPEDV